MVSKYIPYLLLLIIICNILNVWRYLLRCTRLEHYAFMEKQTDETSEEGRIIVRHRQYQIRKVSTYNIRNFDSHSSIDEAEALESGFLSSPDRKDALHMDSFESD